VNVPAGLALTLAAALGINAGYLVQHVALDALPSMAGRGPVDAVGRMLRSRRWRIGAALGYGGLALDVAALTLAPLAVVQSIVTAGAVVVLVGAQRITGTPSSARERVAVAVTVVAVCLLAVGLPAQLGRSGPTALAVLAFLAGTAAVAGLVTSGLGRAAGPASPRRRGIAAGVLYGGTNVALVALLAAGLHPIAVTGVAVAGGATVTAAGFLLFQRGLQAGRPVVVVSMMNAATSVVAVIGGLALFGERLGTQPALVGIHLAAFVAVPVAAVLAGEGVSAGRAAVAR
jgi:hypothetical protein